MPGRYRRPTKPKDIQKTKDVLWELLNKCPHLNDPQRWGVTSATFQQWKSRGNTTPVPGEVVEICTHYLSDVPQEELGI